MRQEVYFLASGQCGLSLTHAYLLSMTDHNKYVKQNLGMVPHPGQAIQLNIWVSGQTRYVQNDRNMERPRIIYTHATDSKSCRPNSRTRSTGNGEYLFLLRKSNKLGPSLSNT